MLASPPTWSAHDHQLSSKLADFRDKLLLSANMSGDIGPRRLLPQNTPVLNYSFAPPNTGPRENQKSTSSDVGRPCGSYSG